MNKLEREVQSLRLEVTRLLSDTDIATGPEKLKELQDRVDLCLEVSDKYAMDNPDASHMAGAMIDLLSDMSYLRTKDKRLAQTKWILAHKK
jgi:hypothetical protein